MREAVILDVVQQFYAAALDGSKWSRTLTAIGDLLGGFDATLEIHSTRHPVPLFFQAGTRIPADGVVDYMAHYCTVCPRLSYSSRPHANGFIGYDYDVMPESELDRNEFYSDFLGPGDLRYFISANLGRRQDTYSALYVHRTPKQGHVGDGEIALMRRIMPHVASAMDVHLRLAGNDALESAFEATLDLAEFGAMLLTATGVITFANEPAQHIMARSDGLATDEGRLRVDDGPAQRTLYELLQSLFRGSLQSAWSWGGDVYVPRRGGQRGYVLSIRRLPDHTGTMPGNASAVVFIRDPSMNHAVAEHLLQSAFGLTTAESDIVCGLTNGCNVLQLAEARQVRVTTVRSQLKRAMHKLNVHSQAELVQLLVSLRVPPK